MRAIEFKSKIRDNSILIPRKVQSEFTAQRDKNVRVVIFVEDTEDHEDKAYRQMTKGQFLDGYAATDAIYD